MQPGFEIGWLRQTVLWRNARNCSGVGGSGFVVGIERQVQRRVGQGQGERAQEVAIDKHLRHAAVAQPSSEIVRQAAQLGFRQPASDELAPQCVKPRFIAWFT